MVANEDRPWLAVYEALGVRTPPIDDRPLGAHAERHAEERGHLPALRYAGAELRYEWLDREASRIAGGLEAHGIGRGDVVGLHMPSLPQYVAALVAISKLGAIGSGVSPLLKPAELSHQLRDCGAVCVLTLDALAPGLAAMEPWPEALRLVVVTAPGDPLAPSAPALPDIEGAQLRSYADVRNAGEDRFAQRPVDPLDTFMIQYTGGTTGRPKGAELSHRTLMYNPLQAAAFVPPVLGEEVLASAFPMFHAAGLAGAINAVIHAALLIVVPDPRDLEDYCAQMKARPPTLMNGVPALYDMLAAFPGARDVDFSRLKTAVSGAAPMPRSTAEKVEGLLGKGKLTDVFGMTETGPCYVGHPQQRYKPGSIGIPLPGADVRIVDAETGSGALPFGEPGEIVTRGPQVMKGYLNLPEESRTALREHDGALWMHSGDVGYMDEEGYLFLCDRAKDMLIVGGFKVFSVEVEDHLQSLPIVAGSAVVGTPDRDRPGNDIVNLYVALSDEGRERGEAACRREIENVFRERMAPYKMPKVIRFVDAIPLTPVGKIDKKVLREEAEALAGQEA
ncbi:class I adenylate-forming enzyme family protein [Parvularcula oceani]|uniref:class I adenylate-forming enzyme family protein n=1 Tax=Parvularcula oceani TaxID=1247963 RepID=UPI0004E0F22C|nr:AMP-binding protein [Parvularcula oceani]